MAFFTYLVPVDGNYPGKTLTFLADGKIQELSPAKVSMVYAERHDFHNFDEMVDVLYRLIDNAKGFLVRGDVDPAYIGTYNGFRRKLGKMGDGSVLWRYDPQWLCLDIDGLPCPDHIDPVRDAHEAIGYVLETLPPYFRDVSCFWQFSSSQSLPGKRDMLKCHLFYMLTAPIPESKLKEWAKANRSKYYIDPSVMSSNQPIFIAPPDVKNGEDVLPVRCGTYIGSADRLDLNLFTQRVFGKPSRVTPIDQKKILSKHLNNMGDGEGKGGFNEVIKSGIGAVLKAAGPDVDKDQLKRDIRAFIESAPVQEGRSGRSREDYMSDEYLDPLISAITARETEQRVSLVNQFDFVKSRYVFITNVNRFYDTVSGNFLSKDSLNMAQARLTRNMADMLVIDDNFVIVDQITYFPGNDKVCTEHSTDTGETMLCYNLYTPPKVREESSDAAKPFIEHVRELAGDETVFRHMMDWMAHNVQFPGVKIMYALLIQGKQGTGKSALLEAMKVAMGEQNVRAIETHEILSQFTSWAKGKALVVVEEIRDSTDRFGVYNRLKPLITANTLTLNEKGIIGVTMRNRMNIMAFTNYETAVPMDEDDRRIFVHFSLMQPKPEEYYQKLFKTIYEHPGAIRKAFLEWDLSHFNPAARAPMTESKQFLVENTGAPLARLLKEATENQQWPMKYDIVIAHDLVEALNGRMKLNDASVAVTLRGLGYKNIGQHRIGNIRKSLWAIRNFSQWVSPTEEELAANYKRPYIDPFNKKESYEGEMDSSSKY